MVPDLKPIVTDRLMLRDWRDDDLAPFRALNADPEVRRYFPKTLTAAESDASAAMIRAQMASRGYGFWALEVPGVTPFAGFTGLSQPGFKARFTPCVEIGWRLAHAFWGRGNAREAAQAAAAHGFEVLGLPEIVAFSVSANARSRAVMAGIGMTHDPADDFDHPNLPAEHPLRRHVLYRRRPAQFAGDAAS